MIDLETRLLEIHEWDEEHVELLYERAARLFNVHRIKDRVSVETMLIDRLRDVTTEEGARLVFKILDQNIRREMRIIEE